MKAIIILQNSNLSFGLDIEEIYQPSKYKIHLIVNSFGFEKVNFQNQNHFFESIFKTEDFAYENILKLVRKIIDNSKDFDVITNSEETMPVCGKIRVALGLDLEDYSRFYDKNVMKVKLSNSKSILVPQYRLFNLSDFLKFENNYLNSLIENLNFPVFAKPVQLYGSLNLKKINNHEDLYIWAKTVTDSDYFEIDEFIEGTMYHCDSFIKDKKILFTLVSQNSRPCYDFTIGKIKGTIVLPIDHPDHALLAEITENTLYDLGMPKGGVTHLELIKTYDNRIYFIEVAHRSPGCLIPKMYSSHASINIIKSHYLLQIDPEFSPMPSRSLGAAWACYPKIPGTVTALNPLPLLSSSCELEWHIKIGDQIHSYSQFGRDFIGTIFMTNKDFSVLYKDFCEINNINLCIIN
jgi:hypothetical protein